MTRRTFILRISGSSDELLLRAEASPGGESGTIRFEQPLSVEDLESLARAVASRPEGVGLRHLLGLGPAAPGPDLMEIGRKLSAAVFRGPIAVAFAGCRGAAEPSAASPLRVEVRIDPALSGAETLHALPWELLIAPGRRQPLALSRWTPVVRYLELPRGKEPPAQPETLRILAVAPRPDGEPALDLERELRNLRAAWSGPRAGRSRVTVETLDPPTLEALDDALDARPVHVLHFMGHGRGPRTSGPRRVHRDLGVRGGGGELLFEAAGGGADPVDAETLAVQLADHASSLRVVVLNACESARGGQNAPVDGDDGRPPSGTIPSAPSVSVAAALVEAGVPAVVAMQHPISNPAAIELSRGLYRSLARGNGIDVAVAEGRRAVRRELRGSREWVTPALFLRSEDGRVFALPETDPEPARAAGGRWRAHLGRAAALAGLVLALLVAGLSVRERWGDWGDQRGGPAEELDRTVPPPPEPSPRQASEPSPFRTLSAGESITLKGASVAVDFFSVAGEELARVTVAWSDGVVDPKLVAGPRKLTFVSGNRTLQIQIRAVDFDHETVTLRVLAGS